MEKIARLIARERERACKATPHITSKFICVLNAIAIIVADPLHKAAHGMTNGYSIHCIAQHAALSHNNQLLTFINFYSLALPF